MQIDSDTLKQGAAWYDAYSTSFDIAINVAILAAISVIRYFVGKRPLNPSPSGLWYVPKVIGMLFFFFMGALHFVAEGFKVMGLTEGSPAYLFVTIPAAVGVLYWAYRVIWRPIRAARGLSA